MPVLTIGQPLETRRPTLLVENKLAAGSHRFALVVVDDAGNQSAPDELVVTVRRVLAPPPAPVPPRPLPVPPVPAPPPIRGARVKKGSAP